MPEITRGSLQKILLKRKNDSDKHQYGHLLIVAGNKNMPGAALLATGAALRSGCGLVTLHSCEMATSAAAVLYPSAMLSIDPDDCFSTVPENIEKYSAIAIGPGLGKDPRTVKALDELMKKAKDAQIPMVIDADAINIIAENPSMIDHIPNYSVLTPNEREYNRLNANTNFYTAFLFQLSVCLITKGYHSRVSIPDDYDEGGVDYENTTGNPGMAKGGSGDVLTGLVGGLLARGYNYVDAACLGIWIHGYAGDRLTEEYTAEAYSAQDLIDNLYLGFKALY